jgi:uncharacterized protein
MTGADLVVRDVPEHSRYEARAGDRVAGVSMYVRADDEDRPVFVFTHTEVDPDFEGRGVGGTLVRGALDDVRRQGAAVVARCQFVHAFVDGHPEYQDLVEPG